MSDLFAGRANNYLKPLLKYCQYEWKEAGGSVEATHMEEGENGDARSAVSGAVSYRGQNIAVENMSVKVLFLKAESITANSLEDGNEENLVALLSIYDDANGIVAADLKKIRGMKAGPAVNDKRTELEQLSGFIKLKKLELSMSRHEGMIAKCEKASDMAHLYDALLYDARAVCQLPALEEDGEDEFFLEANANVLRVRALRAFHTAQLYMSLNSISESLSLLMQAKHLAGRASEELTACDEMKKRDLYIDEMEKLIADIAESLVRAEVRSYLGITSSLASGDLLSQLDHFTANQNITDICPALVPAKPAVFDVAWNHASKYPRREMQNYINENRPKASSGLLGWFRNG